jgi:hypothetical protein
MGQKMEIYKAYVERWEQEHPKVVQPTYLGWDKFDEVKSLALEAHQTGKIGYHCPKVTGLGSDVYLMPDGRVVEIGTTTSGMSRYAVIHASEEDFRNWDEPMPWRAYWEEW